MIAERPTSFLTCIASQRRAIFQSTESAQIVYDTGLHSHKLQRYKLHAFVVMPNHVHVLFEPGTGISLPDCVQFIKGGTSFASRKRTRGEIWQREYHDHRIRDDEEFLAYRGYIERNPARRGLHDWPWIWFASGAKAR
jgi:putative transposase